jgi:hypothetical protein
MCVLRTRPCFYKICVSSQNIFNERSKGLKAALSAQVCFWHHWLIHQPGPAPPPGSSPREAIFARWHHDPSVVDKWDIGGIASDGDLWKHYSISSLGHPRL